MRNLFAAIELRANDYSSDIRKSLCGQAIGQIGYFAGGGTCVRAILAYQFHRAWKCRGRSGNQTPTLSAATKHAHEWSGDRWADGNSLYTRYNHTSPPGYPSCLLGGSQDYDSQAVVTLVALT
jgi:hypothetical protein